MTCSVRCLHGGDPPPCSGRVQRVELRIVAFLAGGTRQHVHVQQGSEARLTGLADHRLQVQVSGRHLREEITRHPRETVRQPGFRGLTDRPVHHAGPVKHYAFQAQAGLHHGVHRRAVGAAAGKTARASARCSASISSSLNRSRIGLPASSACSSAIAAAWPPSASTAGCSSIAASRNSASLTRCDSAYGPGTSASGTPARGQEPHAGGFPAGATSAALPLLAAWASCVSRGNAFTSSAPEPSGDRYPSPANLITSSTSRDPALRHRRSRDT